MRNNLLIAETEGIWFSSLWQLITVIRPAACPFLHTKSFNHEIKDNFATGDFSRPDLYILLWKMAAGSTEMNEFWCNCRKEFLQSLQEKKKWTSNKRSLKVGDIVILQEANTIRNDWQMCRVIQIYFDEKGFVQSVRLGIGSVDQVDRNNNVDRPVSKVVLLLESTEEADKNVLESLPREPWIKCNMISRYSVSWKGVMY